MARLWALFPCCNPKKKAKKRNKLASSQVLEAEVRAAGAGPVGLALTWQSIGIVFQFVRTVLGSGGQGVLASWGGSTPAG